MKHLKHMPAAEYMNHFWDKVLPANEVWARVNHFGLRYISSVHLGFTNVFSILPQTSVDKLFMGTNLQRIFESRCSYRGIKVLP